MVGSLDMNKYADMRQFNETSKALNISYSIMYTKPKHRHENKTSPMMVINVSEKRADPITILKKVKSRIYPSIL